MINEPQVPAASRGEQSTVAELVASSGALTGAELASAFGRGRKEQRDPSTVPARQESSEPTDTELPSESAETPSTDAAEITDEANPASTPDELGRETESETTDELQDDQTQGQKGIKGLQKRVQVLTAKLREAERARDDLKSSPAAAPAQPTSPSNDFTHDPEYRELTVQIDKWKGMQRWARENPSGGEVMDGEKVIASLSGEQADLLNQQAVDTLDDLRAMRAARQREVMNADARLRAQNDTAFTERFPWAQDALDQRSEFIKSLEAMVPEIKRMPGWKLYAGHAVEGFLQAAGKARPQSTATSGRPPRVAVPGGSAAPRVDPVAKQLAEAEAVFDASGKQADYNRVATLKRQMARTRN